MSSYKPQVGDAIHFSQIPNRMVHEKIVRLARNQNPFFGRWNNRQKIGENLVYHKEGFWGWGDDILMRREVQLQDIFPEMKPNTTKRRYKHRVSINNVRFERPSQSPILTFQKYFRIDLTKPNGYVEVAWRNSQADKLALERGLMQLDEEEAKKQVEALLNPLKEQLAKPLRKSPTKKSAKEVMKQTKVTDKRRASPKPGRNPLNGENAPQSIH